MFVREMAIHHTLGQTEATTLPASLQDTIRSRLSGLEDAQVLVLRTVAYLGASATLSRTIAATGLSPTIVGETISQLESDGLLFLDSRSTLGLHECWMNEVIASTPSVAEAAACLQCAKALTDSGLGLLSQEERWRAGDLFSRAGALTEALNCHLAAIDQMLARGLLSQAATALEEARVTAGHSTPQLGLLARTAEIHLAHGDVAAAANCLTAVPRTREEAIGRGEDPTEWVLCQAYRHDASAKLKPAELADTRSLLAAVQCEGAASFSRQTAAFIGARTCLWQDDLDGLRRFYELGIAIGEPHEMTLAKGFLEILFLAELGDTRHFLEANRRLEELETSFAPLRLLHTSKRYRATGLRMHGFLDDALLIAEQVFHSGSASNQNDNACAAAELISFILLDQEMPEQAQEWINRAIAVTPPQSNVLRLKGITHAANRCRWQRGDAAGAAEAMRPHMRQLERDANKTRRFGEVLTYAVASLEAGEDLERAQQIADTVAIELVEMTPTGISDYPAEMLLRALHRSNHPRAEEMSATLIDRRRRYFNRPIAPFFRELNRHGDFPQALYSGRSPTET
jgi:tetratricopeptide (TPR) repeat protein